MTAEVKARIFEPFFTTKEAGQGHRAGAGHRLRHRQAVRRPHRGVQRGRGRDHVQGLPAAGRRTRRGDRARPVALVPPRGYETVLLVEDEDAVRALTRHVLTGCGYTVLEASDGDEAPRVAAGHAGPIHLLVTDVVMPGLGGRTWPERVTERHPEARVLFVSGYTDDAVVRHGVLHEGVNFLQKPFSPSPSPSKSGTCWTGRSETGETAEPKRAGRRCRTGSG